MSTTKIILAKDILNLGEEGDIKAVKRGYARNFLIPQGLALEYSIQNRNTLEKRKAILEKKRLEKKENASQLKAKLETEVITVAVPSGDKGRLYGTITNIQIAAEINKKGYNVDRKSIDLKEHIKLLGKYTISVHLYQDVYAEMSLIVEALQEEKKSDNRGRNAQRKKRTDDAQETTEDKERE